VKPPAEATAPETRLFAHTSGALGRSAAADGHSRVDRAMFIKKARKWAAGVGVDGAALAELGWTTACC